ncbi:hypothetical protein [Halolamina rubra]|uniref:hypothetical protein n=1 Tax=Halolamina rubra TaxID=1380430 RepID=UPI0012ABC35E|nr:hypothetical protein [Halolamina rubra]
MSPCPRSTRERADRVKADLEACDDVLGAVVLDPNEGPRAEWTLEATITGDRLSPAAVQVLANQDCAVISTTPRAPEVTRGVIGF